MNDKLNQTLKTWIERNSILPSVILLGWRESYDLKASNTPDLKHDSGKFYYKGIRIMPLAQESGIYCGVIYGEG